MNALEIRNLTKEYPGFHLDISQLTLPMGCIMGLVGENGAGKSTTIRLILGQLRPDGGRITLLGREGTITTLQKEQIGVVLDEVGLPGCLTPCQVGKIMAGTFRTWEQGTYERLLSRLAVPRDKEFKDLSKGMKMKLGICVAMAHGAKLLILDEATSGLDPVAREEVLELLNEFTRQEDHSVLMSSHIVSDLEKICDYIAFLHKGSILVAEEKDRLREEYGILRCGPGDLEQLDPGAIVKTKVNSYGAQAIVRRAMVSAGWKVSPVTIEELFISMVKED